MKISTRISILFSLVSSVVLIAFGLGIYLQSKTHTSSVFFERLRKRVEITESFFLEKDNFSKAEFDKIKSQFLHTLPKEKEEVIKLDANPVFVNRYSEELKSHFINEKDYIFEEKGLQGASKIFYIEGTKYLVIVTAVDELGKSNLSFLLNVIIFFVVIGVLILFTLFIFFTKEALRPISQKIEHANQISASNLHKRLEVQNPHDELGQMAIAFNNLLDRLEQSFEAQKSFISNASHEIKNPLTAIMGEAEIASSKIRSSKEYLESFSIILSESERLNMTVNNLLQLSKVNANEYSITFEKINLANFIKEIIDSYGFVNAANQLRFDAKLTEEIIIKGNKGLLKTAITNLLDNACKFSNNESVEVFLTLENNISVLKIKDRGIGIPAQDLEKITAPFYRAKNTIAVKGSGIGLSLTKKIITLHNGELFIQSEENLGTEVKVQLPIFQ